MMQNLLERFFKDKNGHVVVWQTPNLPLCGWLVFKLAALCAQNHTLRSGLEQLSTLSLFVWAYLELTRGASYFRRTLGLVIGVLVIVGLFR